MGGGSGSAYISSPAKVRPNASIPQERREEVPGDNASFQTQLLQQSHSGPLIQVELSGRRFGSCGVIFSEAHPGPKAQTQTGVEPLLWPWVGCLGHSPDESPWVGWGRVGGALIETLSCLEASFLPFPKPCWLPHLPP